MDEIIEQKAQRLKKVGNIREVQYPMMLSNGVPD